MLVVLKELWPMALTLLTVVMHCLCTSHLVICALGPHG
jgi:hypothetical protein